MQTIKKQYFYYLSAIIATILLIFLDQLTKMIVLQHLKGNPPIVIIPDVFQLEYLENRGAAFGLFQNQKIFFYASVVFICSIVIWFFIKMPMERR